MERWRVRQLPAWLWVWLALLGFLYLIHMAVNYEGWKWDLAILVLATFSTWWIMRDSRTRARKAVEPHDPDSPNTGP